MSRKSVKCELGTMTGSALCQRGNEVASRELQAKDNAKVLVMSRT